MMPPVPTVRPEQKSEPTTPLGRNLRARREARELSQAVLAVTAGLSPATVARIEAGTINPRLDTLAALAGVLGCSVADLVEVAA